MRPYKVPVLTPDAFLRFELPSLKRVPMVARDVLVMWGLAFPYFVRDPYECLALVVYPVSAMFADQTYTAVNHPVIVCVINSSHASIHSLMYLMPRFWATIVLTS